MYAIGGSVVVTGYDDTDVTPFETIVVTAVETDIGVVEAAPVPGTT